MESQLGNGSQPYGGGSRDQSFKALAESTFEAPSDMVSVRLPFRSDGEGDGAINTKRLPDAEKDAIPSAEAMTVSTDVEAPGIFDVNVALGQENTKKSTLVGANAHGRARSTCHSWAIWLESRKAGISKLFSVIKRFGSFVGPGFMVSALFKTSWSICRRR
jgi:hypothetical protein